MSITKTVLTTLLILGSVSLAQAGARSLVTRDAALPQHSGISAAEAAWLDRASQSSGGGY